MKQPDLSSLPTYDHVTLLLKHHKSTTLLSVLPNNTFDEIKSLLLAALKSRSITTVPGSNTLLPESPSQIELGVLVDKKDASKGWVPLHARLREVSSGEKKKVVGGKNSVFGESVQGARLGDGSWVAWRVKSSRNGKEVNVEDEDEDEKEDVEMVAKEDSGWNVVLPRYEEEFGES